MALRFRILPTSQGTSPAGGAHDAPAEERLFEIPDEPEQVRIGRRPDLEIELPFGSVSTEHARIRRGQVPGEWWLEDLGSTNGTWLDGTRLSPARPVRLRAGQRLRLATVEMVFDGWSAAARGTEGTTSLARRLISDLFAGAEAEAPVLVVDGGDAQPARLRLVERDRRYLIGRTESCDVLVADEAASREHATVTRRWDGVFVADLGSRNGMRVNGTELRGERALSDGDRLQVGSVVLRLEDPESRHLARLRSAGEAAPVGGGVRSRPTPPLPSYVVTRARSSWRRRLLLGAVGFVAFAALAALAALLAAV